MMLSFLSEFLLKICGVSIVEIGNSDMPPEVQEGLMCSEHESVLLVGGLRTPTFRVLRPWPRN